MARRDFRTPASIPVETTGRCIVIPNSPDWLGLLNAALLMLAEQWRYVQVETTDLTPEETANAWYAIYVQSLLSNCESSMFDLRVSPTDDCLIEKTTDGVTWTEAFRLDTDCALTKIIRNPATGEYGWNVEDVGFYKFPDGPYVAPTSISYPPLRPANGATDNDKRCNASYGAALALQALYRQTWDVFTRWATEGALLIAEEMMELADNLFRAVGGVDLFAEIAQDLYAQSASFVEGGFPDSELENVTQILYYRSTITDGVVTFDYGDVVADFGAESGSPYPGLNFLLQLYLGQEGLNVAGGISITDTPFDCDASWTETALGGFGLRVLDLEEVTYQGCSGTPSPCTPTYNSGLDRIDSCLACIESSGGVDSYFTFARAWLRFEQQTITSVYIRLRNGSLLGHTSTVIQLLLDGTVVAYLDANVESEVIERTWTGSVVADEIRFQSRGVRQSLPTYNVWIEQITVSGMGANPFE